MYTLSLHDALPISLPHFLNGTPRPQLEVDDVGVRTHHELGVAGGPQPADQPAHLAPGHRHAACGRAGAVDVQEDPAASLGVGPVAGDPLTLAGRVVDAARPAEPDG